MFYQVLFSLQLKLGVIVSNYHDLYVMLQETSNDFTLRILGNEKKSRKSQNFIKL